MGWLEFVRDVFSSLLNAGKWLGALSIGPSRSNCRTHHLLILYHPLFLPRCATRVSNSKSIFTVIIQCKAMANCLDTLSTSAPGGTLGNSRSASIPRSSWIVSLAARMFPVSFAMEKTRAFISRGGILKLVTCRWVRQRKYCASVLAALPML